jgi:hypothetical protein
LLSLSTLELSSDFCNSGLWLLPYMTFEVRDGLPFLDLTVKQIDVRHFLSRGCWNCIVPNLTRFSWISNSGLHQIVCVSATLQHSWDKCQHRNLTVCDNFWMQNLNHTWMCHLFWQTLLRLVMINSRWFVFGALCARAVISMWCSFCIWAHMFYTISNVQMYNFAIVAGVAIQNLPLHWDSSFVHMFPSTNKFFIFYYPM